MLDKETLADYISQGIRDIVIPAIEESFKRMWPVESNIGNTLAHNFATNFEDQVADQLGINLATAIDSYIKRIEITGTLWGINPAQGSVQKFDIKSTSSPKLNGSLPNTLGVK